MNILKESYPFPHIIVDNFLPDELFKSINHDLNSTKSNLYKEIINNPTRDDLGVITPAHMFGNRYCGDIIPHLKNALSPCNDEWGWTGHFDTSVKSFPPHTDNPLDNFNYKQTFSGIIKGVIYFGNNHEDYTNLGTNLYDNKSGKKVKSVDFIPNRLLLMDTNKDSWHSTDFFNEYPNIRKTGDFNNNHKSEKHVEYTKRIIFNTEYLFLNEYSDNRNPFEEINFNKINDRVFQFNTK